MVMKLRIFQGSYAPKPIRCQRTLPYPKQIRFSLRNDALVQRNSTWFSGQTFAFHSSTAVFKKKSGHKEEVEEEEKKKKKDPELRKLEHEERDKRKKEVRDKQIQHQKEVEKKRQEKAEKEKAKKELQQQKKEQEDDIMPAEWYAEIKEDIDDIAVKDRRKPKT